MSNSELTQTETGEFTEHEIGRGLRQLPAMIHNQAGKVADAEAKVKHTKHILTLAQAATKVENSGKKLTATELNALAYEGTADVQLEQLENEKELELAKAQLQYYRDLFDSVRKAANLRIEELKSIEGTVSRRYQ